MVWLSGKINFQVFTGLSGLVHRKAQSIARQQRPCFKLGRSLDEFIRISYEIRFSCKKKIKKIETVYAYKFSKRIIHNYILSRYTFKIKKLDDLLPKLGNHNL